MKKFLIGALLLCFVAPSLASASGYYSQPYYEPHYSHPCGYYCGGYQPMPYYGMYQNAYSYDYYNYYEPYYPSYPMHYYEPYWGGWYHGGSVNGGGWY